VRLTSRLLADVLADTEQPDDVAVIAARLLPAPLEARLPADPARLSGVRRAVAAWTATAGVPEETAEDLQLALGEALANAVEHAYAAAGDGSGECCYRLARDADGGIRVEVRDTGVWRPPPVDKGYRGRGLDLIHALGSGVEISHSPGAAGTSVRFRMTPGGDGIGVAPRQRPHPTGDGGGTARLLVHDGQGEVRLEVLGELDLASTGPVRDELLRCVDRLPQGSAAVLDLRATTYLASAGVGMVLEALARAGDAGVGLRVRTRDGTPPARILDLAGVGSQTAGTAAPPSS
jgi:anti-anti-sigma factor